MTLLNTSKNDPFRAFEEEDAGSFVAVDPEEPGMAIGDPLAEDEIPAPPPIQGELLDAAALRALNESDDGRNYVRTVNSWYEECRNAMSERRREWRMHEAFERGRQHIYYDEREERIRDLERPAGVPRSTVNKCRGVMRTEVAKFSAQKPTATALPASNDEEDRAAAKAAEQLWNALYDRLNVAAKQRRTARWQSVTGLGYMKPYWDGGKYDATSGEFGDIAIDVVPPYNVFIPDVYVEEIDEQPYIIHAYLLPADKVKLQFGDVLGEDYKPNQSKSDQVSEFGRWYERGGDSEVKQALVKEVWVNPGVIEMFEEGAMLIVIDDKIVEASVTGFPPGYTRYPLVKFEHIPSGIYWPACVFDDLLPLQREINRSNGQVIQLKNAMIANGFFYEDGSIEPEKLTTKPGQAVPYLPGFREPKAIPIPELPPHLAAVLDRTEQQIEDISGQHASTQGRHVPGLEAASAIGQLIEQDEAYISPAISSIERGLSVVASIAVTLFSVYAETERTVKVIGEDQGLDVILMKGSDVMGGTDIRMESSSALPQSKSARQALFIDLATAGALPPGDLLGLLEVPQLSNYLDKQMTRADENSARRENIAFRMMAKMPDEGQSYIDAYYQGWDERQKAGDPETFGQQIPMDPLTGQPAVGVDPVQVPLAAPGVVPVNEWDDHNVHLYVLDLLIKSQWWANCPKPVKAEVQKHRAAHVAALQAQQMQMAAVAPPGGDPAAPPPPPGEGDPAEEPFQEGQ